MNREDEEIKLLAAPKNPYLSKAVSQNYSFNHTLWKLKELHESHGGNPTIDGVVKLKGSIRYKLIYPDGKVDYARVEAFSKYYNYEPAK